MAAFLGVAGAAVAVADNLGMSGSQPNGATFALNLAVVVLAVPMVVGGVASLREVADEVPTPVVA